eukprot:scaffold89774_cov81-Attheya_sp.AAC.1
MSFPIVSSSPLSFFFGIWVCLRDLRSAVARAWCARFGTVHCTHRLRCHWRHPVPVFLPSTRRCVAESGSDRINKYRNTS